MQIAGTPPTIPLPRDATPSNASANTTDANNKQEMEDRAAAANKLKESEERRVACEEEGLTFNHGVVVCHRRWRASSALATVLPAHPCPVHAMRQSSNGRWILSGCLLYTSPSPRD